VGVPGRIEEECYPARGDGIVGEVEFIEGGGVGKGQGDECTAIIRDTVAGKGEVSERCGAVHKISKETGTCIADFIVVELETDQLAFGAKGGSNDLCASITKVVIVEVEFFNELCAA